MKLKRILTAGLLSLTCMATAFGCSSNGGETTAQAKTYVAIDVNPSVELTLDANEKVLSVKALNEDGSVLLFNADVIGDDVEKATEELVELAKSLGFISEINNSVSVSVCGEKDSEVYGKIKAKFEANGENFGVKVEGDINITLSKELAKLKELYADNQAIAALTLSEFRLIKSAMAKDSTLTIEVAVTMDVEDLIKIIKDYNEALDDLDDATEDAIDKIKAEYEAKEQQLIDAYYSQVSPVIAANVQILKDAYNQLRAFEEYELDKYEEIVFTEKNLQVIAEKLGLTEEQVTDFIARCKNSDGKITEDTIKSEIDRLYRNLPAEQREAFEELYDLVDDYFDELEDAITVPTEVAETIKATVEQFKTIVNIQIPDDFATLEDLEDFVEDVIDALEEKIEEVEKIINNMINDNAELKKSFEAHKKAIKEQIKANKAEMEQKIKAEKDSFKDKIQQIIDGKKA